MGRKRNKKNGTESIIKVDTSENSGDVAPENGSNVKGEHTEWENEWYCLDVSPVYGRFLKAKKPIEKGTLLFIEKFLVAGPMRMSQTVCLGCHSPFEGDVTRLAVPCPQCSWPLCSTKCGKSPFHLEECNFFKSNHIKAPKLPTLMSTEFGALAIFRGLLLKLTKPEGWKQLLTLEAHNETRKLLPLWQENHINVIEVLQDWGLASAFTDEEIHTVCGILEVNSFEMGETNSFRGIFPNAAMMAHHCIPNTTRFENTEQGIMEIRAAIDIKAGDALTICYAFSLEDTTRRRQMLMDTKFFECVCERCLDPKELGTNLGTLSCDSCDMGQIVNTGAKETSQIWACENCNSRISLASLESMLDKWQFASNEVTNIESSEKFLRNCVKHFHPTHFIPFAVKFNLCQAYGREEVSLFELTGSDLDRKLQLCKEVMDILDVITPGLNVTRGLVLYELQAAETILLRRQHQQQRNLSKAIVKRRVQNIVKILKEAITILEYSHPSTSEYQMSQAAKKETLRDLQIWLSQLK